jgi:hypothetical protein
MQTSGHPTAIYRVDGIQHLLRVGPRRIGVLSVAVCTFGVSGGSTCERNGDAVAAASDSSHSSVTLYAVTDVSEPALALCGA